MIKNCIGKTVMYDGNYFEIDICGLLLSGVKNYNLIQNCKYVIKDVMVKFNQVLYSLEGVKGWFNSIYFYDCE